MSSIEETETGTRSFGDVLQASIPALTLVGSYMAKIFVQYSAQQAKYQQLMTTYLYDKSLDRDKGVCSNLVDNMHRQEFKEALLAYFFLWQQQASNSDELDRVCESFLEGLGEKTDFEVDDALQKLVHEGLVRDTNGTLVCLPIDKAIAQLETLWKGFYSDSNMECPYCPYLSDGHHQSAA